jgi:hypothetical protein
LDDNTNELNELCRQYEPYTTEGSDSYIINEEGNLKLTKIHLKFQLILYYSFILSFGSSSNHNRQGSTVGESKDEAVSRTVRQEHCKQKLIHF